MQEPGGERGGGCERGRGCTEGGVKYTSSPLLNDVPINAPSSAEIYVFGELGLRLDEGGEYLYYSNTDMYPPPLPNLPSFLEP